MPENKIVTASPTTDVRSSAGTVTEPASVPVGVPGLDLRLQQYAAAFDVGVRSTEQLDKITLVGSAGALLASVTFLKDIAPAPSPGSLIWLRCAWVLFLVGGGVSVASLVFAQVAARRYQAILRAKIEARDPTMQPDDYNPMRKWNSATRRSNYLALILFGAGVALLTWFANLNVPREGTTLTGPARQPVTTPAPQAPDSPRKGIPFDIPAPSVPAPGRPTPTPATPPSPKQK